MMLERHRIERRAESAVAVEVAVAKGGPVPEHRSESERCPVARINAASSIRSSRSSPCRLGTLAIAPLDGKIVGQRDDAYRARVADDSRQRRGRQPARIAASDDYDTSQRKFSARYGGLKD